ncbi:unnamed protein product [Meganyctiphanes norvegica]|uniref:Uncharacterized protein n=1 Tax=Meganyctiphanes norvegica TaxID=48144 RepID=A0AAV2RRD6_MEGNR
MQFNLTTICCSTHIQPIFQLLPHMAKHGMCDSVKCIGNLGFQVSKIFDFKIWRPWWPRRPSLAPSPTKPVLVKCAIEKVSDNCSTMRRGTILLKEDTFACFPISNYWHRIILQHVKVITLAYCLFMKVKCSYDSILSQGTPDIHFPSTYVVLNILMKIFASPYPTIVPVYVPGDVEGCLITEHEFIQKALVNINPIQHVHSPIKPLRFIIWLETMQQLDFVRKEMQVLSKNITYSGVGNF